MHESIDASDERGSPIRRLQSEAGSPAQLTHVHSYVDDGNGDERGTNVRSLGGNGDDKNGIGTDRLCPYEDVDNE